MSFLTEMRSEVDNIVSNYGTSIRLRYYTLSGAVANYDDKQTVTQSGNDIWVYGFKQEISTNRGSTEAEWVEQGKLLFDDSRLYIAGSVTTSGMINVMFGSPTGQMFKILPAGIDGSPELDDTGGNVYKKVFIRALSAGSFYGQ